MTFTDTQFIGGCTYTWGYWKTHSRYGPAAHPDDTWNKLSNGPNTLFFGTGHTYMWILNQSDAGGNAYMILAHQYIAAKLTSLMTTNPSLPGDILAYMTEAEGIFTSHTSMSIAKDDPARARAILIAGILDNFNKGCYSGWPHCDVEYGSITVKLFNDNNPRDGLLTIPGDGVIQGWKVTSDGGPCPCNAETLTADSSGQVTFSNLVPGTYKFTVQKPSFWSLVGYASQLTITLQSGGSPTVKLLYRITT